MRLRIDLAYDGSDFRGWAAQPGLRTVQGELTTALTTALRVPPDAPAPLAVVCAGRTDAGVHARGQVCHVDVDPALVARAAPEGGDRLVRRLNGILPGDVRVRRAGEAPAGFDARFGALWRRYVYRVADRAELLDPLTRGHVLAWSRPLDEAAMQRAAQTLVGRHDFAAFCKRREGATTIRTLLDLDLRRDRTTGVLEATVRADAFCHSMVRSLVGCLLAVGEGRQDEGWAARTLGGRPRPHAVAVAPARGLTLEEVAYPPDDELEARSEQTRARRQEHEVTGRAVGEDHP